MSTNYQKLRHDDINESGNVFSYYENQKITKDVKNEEKAAYYRYQTPEPNYSQFGKLTPEYIDACGREYILAQGFPSPPPSL